MKNKLLKTKLKHYIKIMTILFVVCLIISAAYGVITYSITLRDLRISAEENVTEIFNIAEDYEFGYLGYLYKDFDNIELKITDYGGKTILRTGSYTSVDFNSTTQSFLPSIIRFDQFRKSMSDTQYKKIKAYLSSKPNKNILKSNAEPRYELTCREFYTDKFGFIVPKRVEIVITDDINTWYAEDKFVESFSLNVKKPKGSKLYKGGDMDKNVIDTDFVLKNKQNLKYLDYVKDKVSDSEDSIPEAKLDMFTYVYYSYQYLYLHSDENNNFDIYHIYFANRYNVLEYCGINILSAFAVLLALFIVLGFVLGYVTWKTVKTQIQEDEKRINMSNAMAHDLKTPLFVISGYAENLRDTKDIEDKEYYTDVILKQTRKMNEIIHDMLDLSKLDSFSFQLKKEYFLINELIDEILENYPCERVDFTANNELKINADKYLMGTALENLIDNSIKYGYNDKPIKIKISNNRVEISNEVSAAIDNKDLERIWEPYVKLDASRKSKGNGLGLAIVKRIFQLHNYNFSAEYKNNTIIFWFEAK